MRAIRSIRQKLILALLLVLVPLVIIQVVTIQRWRAARIDAILAGRTDAAYVAGSTFRRYIMDIVHQNYAIAALVGMDTRPVDLKQVKRLLGKLKSKSNAIYGYAVTDANGKILISDPTVPANSSLGDRDYFRTLKTTHQDWIISEMVIAKTVNLPTFIVANSIIGEDGKFKGMVIAGVNVNALRTILPGKLTEGEVVLLDENGRVVFDSRVDNIPWGKRDWSHLPIIREALSGKTVSSDSYISPLTKQVEMGSFVPTEVPGWVAGSFLPADAAMAPVRKWEEALIIGSSLVVLASILLVWFLGTYLTRPILKLTDATTGFASGAPTPAVHLRTGDELQVLAESFNTMKDRIIDRETRLSTLAEACERAFQDAATRAAELEAVLEGISVGVVIAEGKEGRIVRANPAAEAIYGASTPKGVTISEYSQTFKLFTSNGEPFLPDELPLSIAISEGRVVGDQEVVIERPDGSRITVLTTASPIMDEYGEIRGAVAAFQDISIRKRNEERQRSIAEALQDSLLPMLPVKCSGLMIANKYIAALDEARVGGDFLDVFEVAPGKVALVVGDVSGKGLSAAVDVAMTKYYIRSYLYEHPDAPDEVMSLVNNALLRNDAPERFVTAFLAIVDTGTRIITYASAGHEPVLVKRGERGGIDELWPTGLALGIDGSSGYVSRHTSLGPGDCLLLYTDGATEARSPDGEMLTTEGLREILDRISLENTAMAIHEVFEAVKEFSGSQLRDDMALLIAELD